ncbi:MAG: PadR family transcriptional regulator [Streptococcaceae bacterium]|jgi:DNA-binding PadR family transcriptional regulator|nr:PadR family transcriptional regulator [Streptococcaceae bacterium]
MATIDLIVLGMLKQEALSAYDIQKLVDYRNISRWVKISTPSIYKKVIQLEEKGLIESVTVKGKMAEKAIYSLTKKGAEEFRRLMFDISSSPINIFLDLNAVIVNLAVLSPAEQKKCLRDIEANVEELKGFLEENFEQKENRADIPASGLAVLNQQYALVQAIESWLLKVKKQTM